MPEVETGQNEGGSPASDQEVGIWVPDETPMQSVPPAVVMAMQFINLCNQNMGVIVASSGTTIETVYRDLHPTQEAAFRQACALIGTYFIEESKLWKVQRYLNRHNLALEYMARTTPPPPAPNLPSPNCSEIG